MKQPNIIVIMVDQMKATSSHLYGNAFCETPSLERMATEGVLFNNAFTPHPLCVPARISLWTSQFPHTHGGRRNDTLMPERAFHAFKIWKESGFKTGLIGKNHCFESQDDLSLFDVWMEIEHSGLSKNNRNKGMTWVESVEDIEKAHSVRRNMPFYGSTISYAVTDYPLEHYSTGLVTNQTIRFIEENKNEPFALWVSYPDPHAPFEVPEKYFKLFPKEKIKLPPWKKDEFDNAPERNRVLYEISGIKEETSEHISGNMAAYYGMVRFIDDSIGRVLDALEDLELRENTIVVFCSDHGDFMGEHGMIRKGGVFYDCLTRIPLIVSCPGRIASGCTDDSMVNLIDVVPTLLRLQDIEIPRTMQGKALPTVTEEGPRDATFSEYGAGGPPFRLTDLCEMPEPHGRSALKGSLRRREAEGRRKMIRTREWKYVHDPMGDKDELYDMVNDPWELTNVIDNPLDLEILMELRLRLLNWSIETEDAVPVPLP